jgi:hypothetical protein
MAGIMEWQVTPSTKAPELLLVHSYEFAGPQWRVYLDRGEFKLDVRGELMVVNNAADLLCRVWRDVLAQSKRSFL